MTVLYSNQCYNEVCYKGTVLYLLLLTVFSEHVTVMIYLLLKQKRKCAHGICYNK